MIMLMKIKQNIIQVDHILQIMHTEYLLYVALDDEKNAFLNLIKDQPDIGKIHLYAKEPYEGKYQYFINILLIFYMKQTITISFIYTKKQD